MKNYKSYNFQKKIYKILEFNMNKKLFLFLPLLAGVCWGGGGTYVRILNGFGLDSVSILGTRFALATLILFIGILIFNRKLFKIKLKDIWLFIGSGITGVLFLNLCYNEASFTLTLSLAAVLLSLAPIFALFISAILFKEKITQKKIICLIIAIFGCILVTGVLESTAGIPLSLHGFLFGVLSGLFWALYGVFSKIATEKGYPTFTTIFYSFLLISIVLIPITDWGCFTSFISSNPSYGITFAFFHSLTTSILPYLLFTLSLKYIENGQASIICGGAEPLSATFFGFLIFQENPTLLNLIGIIITIIALSILISSSESGEQNDRFI